MTSRERVAAAINHSLPDRLPVDFGSTGVTGIHVSCVAALREHYGLDRRPVMVHEPYQMLGFIEDDLNAAMRLDAVGVFGRKTLFGFTADKWKPWRTFQGLEVLVPGDFNTTIDPHTDDILLYPEGDLTALPSGRMPRGGYFFDTIIRQQPLPEDEALLNPEDNLEEFESLSDEDLAHLASNAAAARQTGRAVVASMPGTAFGDIALVPAPFLKHPRGIRDVGEWYMSTRSRRSYIHSIFERQCEIALGNLETINKAAGSNIDVAFLCGTDFGTQTSSFCSVDTFRELWFPYYRAVNDWIHRNTGWKTFKHSCGSVAKFIPSFIEAGFDILNPVQCSATGMEAAGLKERFGSHLTFWGGGVDTQKTLPFGTPSQVREEVLGRCRAFAQQGGFVFNTIHNIQAGTPVENIVAMLDAVREFNNAGAAVTTYA